MAKKSNTAVTYEDVEKVFGDARSLITEIEAVLEAFRCFRIDSGPHRRRYLTEIAACCERMLPTYRASRGASEVGGRVRSAVLEANVTTIAPLV